MNCSLSQQKYIMFIWFYKSRLLTININLTSVKLQRAKRHKVRLLSDEMVPYFLRFLRFRRDTLAWRVFSRTRISRGGIPRASNKCWSAWVTPLVGAGKQGGSSPGGERPHEGPPKVLVRHKQSDRGLWFRHSSGAPARGRGRGGRRRGGVVGVREIAEG